MKNYYNFEIIEIGQWGNYDYIQKLWSTHEWPGYDILNNNIVTNEERNVCIHLDRNIIKFI
jgi:hypothetical protein